MRIAVLLALAIGAAPAGARADLEVVDSLAWLVADADVIVDGVVEVIRPLGPDERSMAIRVLSVLHGPGGEHTYFRAPTGTALPGVGTRVIAFGRMANGWGFHPTRLLQDGDAVRRRDGTRLIGHDAIVAAIREAPRSSRRQRAVYLPRLDGTSLRIPADAETQRRARAMTESADPLERAMGVQLLGTFESTANVRRLQRLLDDPGTAPGSDRRLVCEHAREVLRRWEVPVAASACE